MANFTSRIAKLEHQASSRDRQRRVISLVGTTPTKEAVAEFLEPLGIDVDSAEYIIVLRSLITPKGFPANDERALPIRFLRTPDWIRAMPGYQESMSQWRE